MKIINPSVELISGIDGNEILKIIELAGRTCYKSEDKITEESAKNFVKMLIDRGHEAMIEHYNITFKFICDRGVTHEIVRHRIASYAQESSRYCNYSKDKFNNSITIINISTGFKYDFDNPNDLEKYYEWQEAMKDAERHYMKLLKLGATPQEARSVLPNSLKTEIIVTMNLREWRHFFKLRTAKEAHPQMREVAIMALNILKEKIPIIFDDIIPYVEE